MNNYPAGVTDKDFDEPNSKVGVTIELDDIEYDTEYGEYGATLVVDCMVINNSKVRIDSGTYFVMDNEGVVFLEQEYEEGQDKDIDQAVYEEALRLADKEIT